MARKQVADLAPPEPLRVPSPVTDFYAPPPKPAIDNNLQNLGNALMSFAPSLANLGAKLEAKNQKTQSEMDQAAAQKFIAGNTNEDYKTAVANGTIPVYADPVANGAIQKNYGMVLGKDVTDKINADIQSGKIDLIHGGNVDNILTGYTKDAIDAINQHYPNSKFAAQGLASVVSSARQTLLEAQQHALVQDNLQQRTGTVLSQFDSFIKGASADQAGGQAANDKIRTAYSELGKTLGLPPQVMDKQLMTALKNNASTSPETVWSILTAPRKDQNGNPLPPLASNPRYAQDVAELTGTLRKALGSKEDERQKEAMIQQGLAGLERQDGSVWALHDHSYQNRFTGEQKVISADEVKKDMMARYQTWSDQQAQARGENAGVQFERDYNAYAHSNVPNPQWSAALKGAANVISSPAALQNPQTREQAKQAGELWMNLTARNWNYVNSTLKPDAKTKSFYDTYEVLRRYAGMNSDQALDSAAAAVNTPESEGDMAVRIQQKKEIAQKVQSDFGGGSMFNPLNWFSSSPHNLGQIQKRVGDVASILVRVHGMTPEDAVTNAEKLIRDRSLTINGHVVTDSGYMPPKEMAPVVGTALQQFFDQNGKMNHVGSVGDLTIEPDGQSGNWRIVDASGPLPKQMYVLKDGKAARAILTPETLHALQTIQQQHSDQNIIDKQNAHQPQVVPSIKQGLNAQATGQSTFAHDAGHAIANDLSRLYGWARSKLAPPKTGRVDQRNNYSDPNGDPLLNLFRGK